MLKGKVIVVTGGSGLLGQRFCEAIARHGGIPLVADINLEQARRVAERISQNGVTAKAFIVDITNPASVENLIHEGTKACGRIDAVINNAYPRNANYGRPLEEVAYADFCENISAHLGGYFLVAQRFAIYFARNSGGNIINMGSIYGSIAPRFELYADTPMTMPVEYAAIKAGIAHLTRYFAQHYKKDGIRVNTLSPGGILDRQPGSFVHKYNAHCGKKGMLEGEDIVGSMIYLLSDFSLFITGQEIIVDDGFSL